jgi:hypothetical protein
VGDSDPDKGTQLVVLSLGDGMGRAALPMQEAAISLSRYCTVEPNAKARANASHANPKTDHVPGVDHPLASDINDITEEDIAAVPRNFIFVCAPECADLSENMVSDDMENDWKPGITTAPELTPLDRLKATGGGWDMGIVTGLFKALRKGHSLPISYAADPQVMEKACGLPDKLTQDHLRAIEEHKSQDIKSQDIQGLSPSLMALYMAILQHPDAQRATTGNMALNGSIIDTDASKHVCKDTETEDAVRSTSLRAGRHERPATKGHNQGLCSANPYAALQEELQYDDQGRQIDDGQE